MAEDVVQTMVQRIAAESRPVRIVLFGSRARRREAEEIASRGQLPGSALRTAFREGKVVYERA
ncbi:MAG TPA: hypothetical protein VNN12_00050 [Dehalococcoidia bacterium]|jgi:hypothetical protein|nr:hypothetical protein [Dehalococcoidia bacterium]